MSESEYNEPWKVAFDGEMMKLRPVKPGHDITSWMEWEDQEVMFYLCDLHNAEVERKSGIRE